MRRWSEKKQRCAKPRTLILWDEKRLEKGVISTEEAEKNERRRKDEEGYEGETAEDFRRSRL
jgi:hypothetical protein